MRTCIHPKPKLKIVSFDSSSLKVEEKLINSKDGLGIKFYQKLFVIFLTSCIFLIFPETPKDSELLCRKYFSEIACFVW